MYLPCNKTYDDVKLVFTTDPAFEHLEIFLLSQNSKDRCEIKIFVSIRFSEGYQEQ